MDLFTHNTSICNLFMDPTLLIVAVSLIAFGLVCIMIGKYQGNGYVQF